MNNQNISVLVTSGGTSEEIDDVRRISNTSTGSLGAQIADAFINQNENINLLYLCSEKAARPKSEKVDTKIITGVLSLKTAVEEECAKMKFDIIIHCMAVSDYMVKTVTDSELMTENVLERIGNTICGDSSSPYEAIKDGIENAPTISSSKISSDKENLIIILEKAPKVIALLRGLANDAVIVGFKLLSNVSEEELIDVGHTLLKKNDCDFVLANDMKTVKTGEHVGFLIDRNKEFEKAEGKEKIAEVIAEKTLMQLSPKGQN